MKSQILSSFQFHKALNASFLNDLFADDPAYAAVVFQGFLEESPPCWNEVEVAFGHNDVLALKAAVHKYRSLFSYVGYTDIAAQLQAVEAACATAAGTAELGPEIQSLRQQRQAAETVIKEETKRLQAFYEK